MSTRPLTWGLLALGLCLPALPGCSSSSTGAPAVDAGQCLTPQSDTYCFKDADCCAGNYCDSVTAYCRATAACGRSGQGCTSHEAACCSNVSCDGTRCSASVITTATSGTGGCQAGGGFCSANTDCCSGFCSPNDTCALPTTGGTTGHGTTSTTGTTGGTCLSSGASCSSGTECCSHTCNTGQCS